MMEEVQKNKSAKRHALSSDPSELT